MKLIHLVPQVHKKSDGVGKFVRELATDFHSNGIDCKVVTVESKHPKMQHFNHHNFDFDFGISSKYGFSFKLILFLWREIKKNPDLILHIHGLWMWQNIIPIFLPKCSYVYSPHGSISDYTFSNLGKVKKIYWHLLQKRVLKGAKIIHVTSELEKKWLVLKGFDEKKIFILNLGMKIASINVKDKVRTKNLKFAFVGRIVPIKNLDFFLEVFTNFIKTNNQDWSIDIIGGYSSQFGKDLFKKYNKYNYINFLGELIPDEVSHALRKADIAVLPSFSENFSYSILEAITCGCYILSSTGTPWFNLLEGKYTYEFNPKYKSSLNETLVKIKGDDENSKIWEKLNVASLAKNNFCIKNVSKKYIQMYSDIF